MSKTITAVFSTRDESETALRKLDQAGYTRDQVALLVSEETRGKHFGINEKSKAEEGAATGAVVGGLAGALYLALASAGTLLIPGLNIVISGALIGSLAGLGAGATTGGLIGALIGLGVPEHEVKVYEDAIRKGAFLIAVEARDATEADRIRAIMKGANALNITALAA